MLNAPFAILRASTPPRGAVFVLAAFIVLGCSSDGLPPRYTVTGKVMHQGQPVEKGMVQFENPAAGQANSAPLGPGGSYSLDVPAGDYKVTVYPPTVLGKAMADSPPDEIPDPTVKNIPVKYRTILSSPLTAQVDKGKQSFDFELKP